jgi:membrane protein DedA with SNARE-associated domain
MHWIYHIVRHLLLAWGYWAVLAALLAEDAGLPLPGETVLIFASFLSHKSGSMQLGWIIAIGILAAVMGDNIGYLLGHKFGPTLIRWTKAIVRLDDEDIRAAKDLIRRRGGTTIFFARFIFGLRTVAGPLAGMLDMAWKKFFLYNILGAAAWVTTIAVAGFLFANTFDTFLNYFETAGWALAAGLFALGYILWRRQKKRYQKTHHESRQHA